MLKNILKLEGAQKLTKNEQKNINGGIGQKSNFVCCPDDDIIREYPDCSFIECQR
jgi:hypothetical protein